MILEELNKRSDVELHIVIAGTALLPKYASRQAQIDELLRAEGFKNIYEVHFNLEGSKPIVKAKSAGLGVIELASLYNQINPDIIVVRGDRFEVLSAATAAALMHIPIAHIEGGDISGTIDESIRHTVTKLSHLHFATNNDAQRRIIQMGENPKSVFNFGSPDVEVAVRLSKDKKPIDVGMTGSGASFDVKEGFIMVAYHPVTTEIELLSGRTRMLLEAMHELGYQTLWFWPNFDAGSEEYIAKELRIFNDQVKDHRIRFMRYIHPRQYLTLLRDAKCLVGNSSAGIKECSYLGTPVVNIGTRQNKRLRTQNVVDVKEDKKVIQQAIQAQIKRGRMKPSLLYYRPGTGKNIARVLATARVKIQKQFHE